MGKIDSAPAGAVTAGAVGKYREESCWSRHYCGSGENREKVPAGAGTAAAVKKTAGGGIPMVAWGCWEGERGRAVVGGEREGGGCWVTGRGGAGGKSSCWSEHCCGSEEI